MARIFRAYVAHASDIGNSIKEENCCPISLAEDVFDGTAACVGGAAGTITSKALVTGGASTHVAYAAGLGTAGACTSGGFAGCAVSAATAFALRSAYRYAR